MTARQHGPKATQQMLFVVACSFSTSQLPEQPAEHPHHLHATANNNRLFPHLYTPLTLHQGIHTQHSLTLTLFFTLYLSLTVMLSSMSCRLTGTPGFSWCLNSRKRTTRDTAVCRACWWLVVVVAENKRVCVVVVSVSVKGGGRSVSEEGRGRTAQRKISA